MNSYLLVDKEDGNYELPLIKIIAENKEEALYKAIKGLINDEILTVEDICEYLGFKLEEIVNITTYE